VCRQATLNLPALPSSPRAARRFLADACLRWELPELQDNLVLAVSELVTNSVLHARTPMSVTGSVARGVLEVGVQDYDSTPPVVRPSRRDLVTDLDTLSLRFPTSDDADPRHPMLRVGEAGSVSGGRGLHLLDAVSDEWGVVVSDDYPGKVVWFAVGVPRNWPYGASCPCATAEDRTSSGRSVTHVQGPWDLRGELAARRA
jgi:hypothetical protein